MEQIIVVWLCGLTAAVAGLAGAVAILVWGYEDLRAEADGRPPRGD